MTPTVSFWIVPPVPTSFFASPVTRKVPGDAISLIPAAALLLETEARLTFIFVFSMSTAVPLTELIVPPTPAVAALLITSVPPRLENKPVPLTLVTLSELNVVAPVLLWRETPGAVTELEMLTGPLNVVLPDELLIEIADEFEPISLLMVVVPVTDTVPLD